MKNKISHRRLGRNSAHRQQLFRNMVSALVQHERIRTTVAKAKEIRRFADGVITWAKTGGHLYHVKAQGFLRTHDLVKKLFTVLGPRYADREGGYTRVVRAGYRRGDRAEMAIIEYVGREGEVRPALAPRPRPAAPAPEPERTLAERADMLRARQAAALAGAPSASASASAAPGGGIPLDLLPAFPSPSRRPLRMGQMEELAPGWAEARAAARAKVAASRRRRRRKLVALGRWKEKVPVIDVRAAGGGGGGEVAQQMR